MEEVKNTLTTIRGLFEGYRKETPEATDDAIRDLICEKSAAAKSMREKTHPKLFLAVTSRETSEDQFSMISFQHSLAGAGGERGHDRGGLGGGTVC